ncbi:TPA: NUDIX domain-containing protein [Candidatus Woesearchaeota archaeon]|nr:NUDIX domain-containing protein [Candidatus Woesearchaeota archaeon]
MKIPDNAKRVFKGKIFDVYQWPQRMFDGSVETFEMVKRPNTIEVIPTVGDRIYIAEQEQPNYGLRKSFFGGRQEEGEEPIDTAKRELLEESGLESGDWELIKVFRPLFKLEWEVYVFVARNCRKTSGQRLDPGERITPVAVSFDEFVDFVSSRDFWGREFSDELYRLKIEGRLDEIKKKLFR